MEHFDALPELKKSKNPLENKNRDFIVQAMLMTRSPLPQEEWIERHAAAFRKLYDTDHDFRDLVNGELDDDIMRKIQEQLDDARV